MSHIVSSFCLLIVSCNAFKYGNIIYDHEAATVNRKCLVKYINRIFDTRMVLAYRETEVTRDLTQLVVDSLLASGNLSHAHNVEVLTRLKLKCGGLGYLPHSQYVVYVNRVLGLPIFFERFLCFEWPLNSRFIVVSNRSAENIDEFLQVFRYYLVFNAVLISSWNETSLTYYRARPRCTNSSYVDEPVTYHCSSEIEDRHLKPFIDIQTLPKCDFKVGIRIASPYTLKSKDRHANLKHKYIGIEMMIIYDVLGMEPAVSALGPVIVRDLIDKRVDFICGALSINVFYPLIANSYPYLFSTLVAVIKEQHSLGWLGMFSMFSPEIWLFVGAVTIAFALTACLLQRWHEGTRDSPRIDTIFMKLLTALFGKGIEIKRRYLRILLMAWIWFVFVLRSSYEAQSILQYMSVDTVHELSTLDELCQADFKIFTSVLVDTYFRQGLQLSSCFLPYDRFISVDDPLLALHTASSPHAVAFMYKHTYTIHLSRFIESADHQPFQVVKETLYFVPFVFYFHRGDPLKELFDRRGAIMFESGLIAYMERRLKIVTKNRMEAVIHAREKDERRETGLSMKDMKVLFYLYGSGVVTACIILVLENMYYYFMKKYREWFHEQLRNMDELMNEVS